MTRCRPHRWNVEDWLPIMRGTDVDASMRCLNCGRLIRPQDTTLDMRVSIARAIARRLYGGDEEEEVYDSVMEYFRHHLT